MKVRELIEILKDHDPEVEVELAVVAPVDESDEEDITVDRYPIEGVMPWEDDEDGSFSVWLVGGDDADVEAFIDAIEDDEDGNDEQDGH